MTENNNIDDLLVKVVLGESTAEELSFVRGWIAQSPANERYFTDFQRIWEESRNLAVRSTVNEEVAWGRFKERVGRGVVVEMGSGRSRQWKLRVAAVFVVVVAGGWFFYTYSYKPGQFLSVSSGVNVLSDTLPEGSVVTMNKESSIHYRRRFAGDIRKVEMEGEAFLRWPRIRIKHL